MPAPRWRGRVVEEPITAYLQWELHALRIRDQCGGSLRIVGPDQVAEFEHDASLPEIYTLGATVMYRQSMTMTGCWSPRADSSTVTWLCAASGSSKTYGHRRRE